MKKQRGVILVVGLIFLLVLALLGIAGMTGNVMQERVVGNTRDNNTAFQAAEAGLRDAEQDVQTNLTPSSGFNTACTNGLCLPPTTTSSALWTSTGIWSNAITYGAQTGASALPDVSSQPQYIIEELSKIIVPGQSMLCTGSNPCPRGYRITTIAHGARPETTVILQSVYAK